MKKLNFKRLAAIATGAALVGAAALPLATAAFTDLQKGDVVNETTGVPLVSIVVGSNAAVSDVVWAGNIAATVAQLATRPASVTQGTGGSGGTPTDLTVDLMVGGTTTVSGGKQFRDSYLTSVQGNTTSGRYEFGRSTTVQGVTLSRPIYLSGSQVEGLYDSTDTIRYNGTDSTISIKEYIGVNADVRFDSVNQGVYDLAMFLNSENDFNYTLDLGSGIYRYETTAGTTNFQDDSNDNIRIPWLMSDSKFVVQQVVNTDTSSINYVRLLEDKEKQTLDVLDTFEVIGKAGYPWAGQTLTVELSQVGQTSGSGSYQAKFTLKDADGQDIDSQVVTAGNYVLFEDDAGNYIVQDNIYIPTSGILVTNTQDLSTASVDVYVGAATVDLYDGKGYPYDASNTTGPWDWKVTLTEGTGTAGTSTDANKLLSIAVGNSAMVWDTTNPIYPSTDGQSLKGNTGSVINFLEGTGDPKEGSIYLDFKGWEEKESTTPVTIGNNWLTYRDSSGTSHNIPFYINLSLSSSGNSFVFDTKTWYYKTNSNDVNFTIGNDNNTLNGLLQTFTADYNSIFSDAGRLTDVNLGVAATTARFDLNMVSYICTSSATRANALNCMADGNIGFAKATLTSATSSDYVGAIANAINKSWYYDDGNTTRSDENRAFRASPVTLEGANSQTYQYALWINESYAPSVWLLLDDQNLSTEYTKNVNFAGTDTGELGNFVPGSDPAYYYPDALDIGGNPADYSYYLAHFGVDENNSSGRDVALVYIDTATAKTMTYPNNNLSNYTSDVNFYNLAGGWETGFYLRNDEPYLHAAYTDWGSKFTLANGVISATLPQNRRYLDLLVGSTNTSETVTDGDALTGLAVNDTGTTPRGTRVTVTNITGTCSAGSGACTPSTYPDIVPVSTLVYTDTSAPSGRVIAVGGHLVNTVSSQIAPDLADRLTTTGEKVAEKLANGNILVAGFTAADTGSAADELIRALRALTE